MVDYYAVSGDLIWFCVPMNVKKKLKKLIPPKEYFAVGKKTLHAFEQVDTEEVFSEAGLVRILNEGKKGKPIFVDTKCENELGILATRNGIHIERLNPVPFVSKTPKFNDTLLGYLKNMGYAIYEDLWRMVWRR